MSSLPTYLDAYAYSTPIHGKKFYNTHSSPLTVEALGTENGYCRDDLSEWSACVYQVQAIIAESMHQNGNSFKSNGVILN